MDTNTLEFVCDVLTSEKSPALDPRTAPTRPEGLLCRLGLHEWMAWSAPFSLGGPVQIQSRRCDRCGCERRRYR